MTIYGQMALVVGSTCSAAALTHGVCVWGYSASPAIIAVSTYIWCAESLTDLEKKNPGDFLISAFCFGFKAGSAMWSGSWQILYKHFVNILGQESRCSKSKGFKLVSQPKVLHSRVMAWVGLPGLPRYLKAELQKGPGLCWVGLGKGQILSLCKHTAMSVKQCCEEGRWLSPTRGVSLQ